MAGIASKRRARRGNKLVMLTPQYHSLRGLPVVGSGTVRAFQTWISVLAILTLVNWNHVFTEAAAAVVDMKSKVPLCGSGCSRSQQFSLQHQIYHHHIELFHSQPYLLILSKANTQKTWNNAGIKANVNDLLLWKSIGNKIVTKTNCFSQNSQKFKRRM